MQASTFNNVDPLVCDVSEYIFAIMINTTASIINTAGIPNANVKQSSLPKHLTSCRKIGLIIRDNILPQLYIK